MRFLILVAALTVSALWGATAWLLSEPISVIHSEQSAPTSATVGLSQRNSSAEQRKLESPMQQAQPAIQMAPPSGQVAIDAFATGGAEQVLVYPAIPMQPRQRVEDEDRR